MKLLLRYFSANIFTLIIAVLKKGPMGNVAKIRSASEHIRNK